MTIIDFHTHVGEVVGKSPDDLLYSMDEAKIDKSVIFAGGSLKLSNEELIKIIEAHPDRFLGAIYFDPTKIYYSEYNKNIVELLKYPSIVGAKFYCGYEYFYPNDIFLQNYFQILESRNKLAIFHLGDTYSVVKTAKLKYAQPIYIDDVAVDYPNLKIVMAHMAYPWHRDAAEIMYKNSNVYADVSGFVYGDFTEQDKDKFKTVWNELQLIYGSTDRLLFGTDSPISTQHSYVKTLKELNLFESLTTNTNQLISIALEMKKVK